MLMPVVAAASFNDISRSFSISTALRCPGGRLSIACFSASGSPYTSVVVFALSPEKVTSRLSKLTSRPLRRA